MYTTSKKCIGDKDVEGEFLGTGSMHSTVQEAWPFDHIWYWKLRKYVHHYTRCTNSQCMPHARIFVPHEPTRDITVGRRGTSTVGHVQGSVSSVSCCRRSCSACSLADLWGWSAFLKTAMRFILLVAAPLSRVWLRQTISHTHQSGLQGVVVAFGSFVVASVFAPVSYLFLPHSPKSPPF